MRKVPSAQLDAFLAQLQDASDLPGVFNPWKHHDVLHDQDTSAVQTRVENLRAYLSERIGVARLILCAEALGYQGGHFSGIPMTSERMLVGNLVNKGILPGDVFQGAGERRCRVSRVDTVSLLGANEPTATVVWGTIKQQGRSSREIVLWNAFAFHPMRRRADGAVDWLSNRKPTAHELQAAQGILKGFIALFEGAAVVAVGNVAQITLAELGVPIAAKLRHPANGGAAEFRKGLAVLMRASPGG
jgi:hypothetical protein